MSLLCLLSPAKRMEYRRALPFACALGTPSFAREARRVAKAFKDLSAEQLQDLMGVSENLARRTHAQYQAFDAFDTNSSEVAARPALYAFHGDTYIGLNAYAWDKASVARSQKTLRILSGLYGLLRPLDAIQPYRCEMGLRLGQSVAQAFDGASTPAAWWRTRVTQLLRDDIEETGAQVLVNLASKEYAAAVDRSRLTVPFVEVVFAEERNGTERRLGMLEKRMRGVCAKFIVENNIKSLAQLRDFGDSAEARGYTLSQASSESLLRFVKPASAVAA